jgi:hypothetical protein
MYNHLTSAGLSGWGPKVDYVNIFDIVSFNIFYFNKKPPNPWKTLTCLTDLILALEILSTE